jgi:hypothetical protein
MRGDGPRAELSFGWGDQASKAAVLHKGDVVSFAVSIDRPTKMRSVAQSFLHPFFIPACMASISMSRAHVSLTWARDGGRRAMRVTLVQPAAGEPVEPATESEPVQGVVVSVKGSGGFVRCCDRDARVYFAMADVDPASLPARPPRAAAPAQGGERHGHETTDAAAAVGGGKGEGAKDDGGGHEEVMLGMAV